MIYKDEINYNNVAYESVARGGGALDLKTTVRAAQNLAFKIEPLQCSTKW